MHIFKFYIMGFFLFFCVNTPLLPMHKERQTKITEYFHRKQKPHEIECCICLGSVSQEIKLSCGHSFDFYCLKPWADRNSSQPTCPRCSKIFDYEELTAWYKNNASIVEKTLWSCKKHLPSRKAIHNWIGAFIGACLVHIGANALHNQYKLIMSIPLMLYAFYVCICLIYISDDYSKTGNPERKGFNFQDYSTYGMMGLCCICYYLIAPYLNALSK